MHLKRQQTPKSWPVYRKGTKYVVRPSSDPRNSIPLLVVLRDLLKVVQKRKEARRAIFTKEILVNQKTPKDGKHPVYLFDTISIVPEKKNYRLDLSGRGKFEAREISEAEAARKAVKIINKRMLRGKEVQLNLLDGRNLLSKEKCSVNDSVLIDLKNRKIEKCLHFKDGAKAVVFMGKHAGKRGIIKAIDKEKKTVELETGEKSKINVLIKQIMVTGGDE